MHPEQVSPAPNATARTIEATPIDQIQVIVSEPGSGRVLARQLLFSVPEEDLCPFARLPEAVRNAVLRLLGAFGAIHASDNKKQACTEQAMSFGCERGFTADSLKRKYYAYVRSGDWRVCLDKAKAGPEFYRTESSYLPAEFVEHWRGLCERNQRKCKPAWRALLDQWKRWRGGDRKSAVPGYEKCPADSGRGWPEGWSYENLQKRAPSRFELTAARIGRSAAYKHRPLVFTTRVGLSVGEYYLFDDFWHDFKVNVLGQRHAQRLLQFHALDLFSGCNFARGMKPVLEHEITRAQERLKEVEMVFLVAHVLAQFGYRPEGTVLVVEHGTAAIREDVEKTIHDLTNGKVRVERSGMEGAAAFAGMYAGRGKGNFRFKAALESIGNLIHNETANTLLIPGQVGKDRDHCPEELHGREKLNDQLLRAILALPAERAASLRLPFLELNQAIRLVTEIHDRINDRTEHDLEGWIEAGLVTTEFRLGIEHVWMPAARLVAMPGDQRQAIEALISTQADLTRARRLSPAEVFARGSAPLIKLPAHKVAMLLGPDRGRDLPAVRGSMIEFADKELSPSVLRYEAVCRLPGNAPMRLPDGEKFSGLVNPLDLDALHLFNARGGYLGACRRMNKICRSDTEALHRACGAAAKAEAELLVPVAARGAEITRQRIADAKHNAGVLAPAPGPKQSTAKALEPYVQSIEEITETLSPAGELTSEQFTNEEIADLFASPNQTEEERNGIDS